MDQQLQRQIEKYELAVAFAREFIAEIGKERALRIIGRVFEKQQANDGRNLARKLGRNTFQAFSKHYQETEPEKDYLEVLEVSNRHIALKISRCRAWEAFKKLGMPELCPLLCEGDYAFSNAFNPKMKLIRTKTIADGDDYCDHIWVRGD